MNTDGSRAERDETMEWRGAGGDRGVPSALALRVRVTVQPLIGKQRRSVELANARLNLWEGSVRSSKTICSLLAWLLFVRTGPAGNLAMIGRTERTLKRNIIDPLVDMLGPKRCRYIAGSGELWLLGRRIYIVGANDARAQEKLRGLTLVGAYIDEVTVIPEPFWSMLLSRLSVDGARLYGTTNPDNPNHWLMRDFLRRARVWLQHDGTVAIDPKGLDLARFSFRLADNPTLSAAYLAALAQEFTGLWRKRFIEGLWVLAEGAIYDTFDSNPGGPHVVTTLPDIDEWVLAVDYGTINPFVALLLGLGTDDRIYVAREWRWDSKAKRRQLTDAQYSTELRSWLPTLRPGLGTRPDPTHQIIDPSAASFIAQLYRDNWVGVTGADNTVADGLRSTASLLAGDRLKIHASCTGLIEEIGGYVWDEKAAQAGEEKPLKIADHGPDALRYGVMGTRRWWRWWLTDSGPQAETAA